MNPFRFVLLKHDHPHLHWDLMLQDGAVLKTWRLAEPLTVGRDIHVEPIGDHRLAYLDYEGPVSGGRGSVKRILVGSLEWLRQDDESMEARLTTAELTGVLLLRRSAAAWTARWQRDTAPFDCG